MRAHLFEHTSFGATQLSHQAAILELYQEFQTDKRLFDKTKPDSAHNAFQLFKKKKAGAVDNDLKSTVFEFFKQRKSLAANLDFYASQLSSINTAKFRFLNDKQRDQQKEELLFTFYLLSAQYVLDSLEDRDQVLSASRDDILQCAALLEKLESTPRPGEETPEDIQAQPIQDAGKHLKYFGLSLGRELAHQMVDLSGTTHTVRSLMGAVNRKRLYWVWAGSMLGAIISMLSDDFFKKTQASAAVSSPAPVTGYMSWVLYYARFGMNLGLLLKHTIAGPWMSEAERSIPTWERFKTQWAFRKFDLLNDSIWATANLACFFWLVGNGLMGYLGNVATAGLLIMDVCLTAWRFCEQVVEHEAEMRRFALNEARLVQKLKIAEEDKGQLIAEYDKESLALELKTLRAMKKKCEFDWQYKKYGLITDLAYAVSLLGAFSLMCCFFFPPAAIVPAAAMALAVAGAALCFVLTVIYSAMNSWLETAKLRQSHQLNQLERDVLLEKFNAEEDPNVKKQYYLDIKGLEAKTHVQAATIAFQKKKLIHAIVVDALIPALLFASFVFLPLGIGLGVVAAGFAIALMAHYLLNSNKPPKMELPEFDNAAYEKFVANPSLPSVKPELLTVKSGMWKQPATAVVGQEVSDDSLSSCAAVTT